MEIGSKPATVNPWGNAATVYEEIGGDAGVRALVDRFYDLIEAESPVLRAMLPRNTSTSRQKLYEFLSGWMGGPSLYIEKRGHPRLKMRHMPFDIGHHEAEEWMRCMRQAMTDTGVPEDAVSFLDGELSRSADWMRNRPDPGVIVPEVSAPKHEGPS